MKQADIKIGGTYRAYIGADLCPVVVVERVFMLNFGRARSRKTRFRVRRLNDTSPLPKLRTAAALRE